ncbi:MAG TPA: DUF935 family protein [Thermoanaerobaculia bacterium]|nr:DUF935 family protein [Thermoanaerobaculia bacterium]
MEHTLSNEITIKPAKAASADDQPRADDAAERMKKAWARVRNAAVVLQSLLMGEYYGFARAEMVARFDEVVKEWIPDLYDVDQEAWLFHDDGRSFVITTQNPQGIEVDDAKFVHFQSGSADTKYGYGRFAYLYTVVWKIQQLEDYALQAIEDFGRPLPIVHIPRGWDEPEKAAFEAALDKTLRNYLSAPTNDLKASVDMPTGSMSSSGAAGRQEFEAIGRYETWIQVLLLGAPQTGNKSLGTGKLEETRRAVWDDKTPLHLSALDNCLNGSWRDTYCRWNLADLPVELWPRFESDSTSVSDGLTGIQAQTATDVLVKLGAQQITATAAVELLSALGLPRARAVAMVESTVKERESLRTVVTAPSGSAPVDEPPPADGDPEEEEEAA